MTKFCYLWPKISIKSPKEHSLLLICKVQIPVESVFIERLRQIVTEEVTNNITFFNGGEHPVPKSQDSFYRIREIQFGAISFHWAITLQPTVNDNWGQTAKNCHSYFCEERHILFVANCTNLSPRKSGQVFDSKFVPGYKQSTLSAIRTVLLTRNLPEEKIYKFFSSLRNNNISGAPVEVLLAPFMRKQSKYQKRLSDLLTGYFQWRTTPGKLK